MSPRRTRPRPRRRLLVGTLAALAVAASVPVAASAEPSVDELRGRAASIGARLEELGTRSSELDEEFNATSLELEELEAQLAAQRAEVEAARSELDEHRQTARRYAIDAYVTGGTVDELLVPSEDHTAVSRRRTYLSALNGDRRQVIDDVAAAQAELADQEAVLDARAADIADKKEALEASRTQLAEVIDEQEELQASISGELAEAVAAEQARIRAAQEAAAQAQAEATAQRAAARQSTTTAAPGSSTTAAPTTRPSAPSSSAAPAPTAPPRPTTPPPPPVVAPPPPPAGGPAGAATAIAAARSVLGTPYRWGGSSPASGFDCSGLIMWAYAKAGRSLPHSSRSLRAMTRPVSAAQLRPGDLVFGGSPVHHVGMYVGGGQMIHSPRTGDVVKISGIYSSSKPVSFGAL